MVVTPSRLVFKAGGFSTPSDRISDVVTSLSSSGNVPIDNSMIYSDVFNKLLRFTLRSVLWDVKL